MTRRAAPSDQATSSYNPSQMRWLEHSFVKLLVATLVVAALLAGTGVIVAAIHGGATAGWVASMLIYGGGLLLFGLAVTRGIDFPWSPIPVTYLRGAVARPLGLQVLFVPLGVIGLGALAHLYL